MCRSPFSTKMVPFAVDFENAILLKYICLLRRQNMCAS
nr:MAG TPA: hypothetical protein [Caudoviricetes sp.]